MKICPSIIALCVLLSISSIGVTVFDLILFSLVTIFICLAESEIDLKLLVIFSSIVFLYKLTVCSLSNIWKSMSLILNNEVFKNDKKLSLIFLKLDSSKLLIYFIKSLSSHWENGLLINTDLYVSKSRFLKLIKYLKYSTISSAVYVEYKLRNFIVKFLLIDSLWNLNNLTKISGEITFLLSIRIQNWLGLVLSNENSTQSFNKLHSSSVNIFDWIKKLLNLFVFSIKFTFRKCVILY